MKKQHKVLLLGSGLMTPPLIRELISHGDTKITIASNMLKEAQGLAAKAPEHLTAVYLDVKNQESLDKMISDHDAVISFIPPWMHTPIAHACLKIGRNMITSSYISPDMEAIHSAVK